MTDVHKLIDSILSDPRLANSRAFSGKMYEDEPILRTGSQMKNYLPQRYRDMKALAFRDRAVCLAGSFYGKLGGRFPF